LYKNRKETAQKEKQYTKQYKNNIKITKFTKWKTKIENMKRILQNRSPVIGK